MSATAFQRMRREQAAKRTEEKDLKPIDQMTAAELKTLAKEKGVKGYDNMKKAELIMVLGQDGGKEPDEGGGANESTGEAQNKAGDGTE